MAALKPKGIYILIDTGTNRLYLMRDECILRAAVCSTGSGRFLPDPPRNREWTFDTPKGLFRIQRKFRNPVWIKPDWAFLEEGESLPSRFEERLAPGELGDYAMDLGDGYLIHGTLYERSLGLSVTHGCVRLGAKDLDAIYHTVRIGTPVFIF
jgi:L,D-transpeptidase YbiS